MDIQGVAKYQKWILFAILAQIIISIVQLYFRFSMDEATTDGAAVGFAGLTLLLAGVNLAISIFAVVALVFLMTALDRPTVSKVLAAIAMFIPLVGLIVLLVVNQRATKTLQANGIRVGLMGAKRG